MAALGVISVIATRALSSPSTVCSLKAAVNEQPNSAWSPGFSAPSELNMVDDLLLVVDDDAVGRTTPNTFKLTVGVVTASRDCGSS